MDGRKGRGAAHSPEPSPSTLNPRLSGWSLFSGWKCLAKALHNNRNTVLEAKVRRQRQTKGPGSMDTHCTTLGGAVPGTAVPALSTGEFAIVWALIWVTDHIPFSLWLLGSSGSAASVHPSPWLCTNPIPDSVTALPLSLTHSVCPLTHWGGFLSCLTASGTRQGRHVAFS